MKGTIIFDLEGTLVDRGSEHFSQIFISEQQLCALAREYHLALVTGASRADLNFVLQGTYLGNYFDYQNSVSRDDTATGKETGAPFQRIVDRMARPAVVIGDSVIDATGAAACGIPFVMVDTARLMLDDTAMETYLTAAKAYLVKPLHRLS